MLRSVFSSHSPPISTSLFFLIPSLKFSSFLASPIQFTLGHQHNPLSKPLLLLKSFHHSHSLRFEGFSVSPVFSDITASYAEGESERERLVQHLLVKEDDHKLLVDLEKRISEGEDLSDLAEEHSICPSNVEGGMLGWVRKGQMVPEFEDVAFSAPLNKIVRCKTEFGWHLLQVISERESMLGHIQPTELHVKMQDPSFLQEVQLIDVREADEVSLLTSGMHAFLLAFCNSNCNESVISTDVTASLTLTVIAQASLPGFKVLPLSQFAYWGPKVSREFDPEKDTYVLCHHGMRSLKVAKWLRIQSFKRVFNVSGGIHEYALRADPSIPTY